MLKLIKNELIKIFSKKGIFVFLALIILCAIAYQGIMKIDFDALFYYDYASTSLNSELEWLKRNNNDGAYDVDIALIEKSLELGVKDAYVSNGEQSWQGSALSDAFNEFYSYATDPELGEDINAAAWEKLDSVIDIVKNNDYLGWYKFKVSSYPAEYTRVHKLINYLLDNNVEPSKDNWQYSLVESTLTSAQALDMIDNSSIEQQKNPAVVSKYELCVYRLDNDIPYAITYSETPEYNMLGVASRYHYYSDFWSNFCNASGIMTFTCVLMVVLAAGMIAREYSDGTIKFLLINPVSRTKIFFSKYLTLIILSVAATLLVIVVNFIAVLVFGNSGLSAKVLSYSDGHVSTSSVLLFALSQYFLIFVKNLVIMTMAFMISSLLKSSAVSTGVSIAALLLGNTINAICATFGLDFARYFIFSNWDIQSIIDGNSYFSHMSVSGAVINIAIYMIIFILTAHDAFTRKEL